ncbi:MAG: DUF2807 domain-containing protein [Bacteroidetes bacterium]|nr:DUF2807 domain-containing protein [Bacteroidota bacterium]
MIRTSAIKWKIYLTRRLMFMARVLMVVLFAAFQSCQKDHFFDFLKSTGKDITVERSITDNFSGVRLENNINLVLTQGPSYSITLEGGENLLPGIETEIKDSVLTIRNHNKFNWVRSYDRKITARVTAPHFLNIGYYSTGILSNTDTLREDSIFITSYGGSGYINLVINTKLSHLALNSGSADLNISGSSDNNFIFAGSYGPFHCKDLLTRNTFMNNKGTNDCYINVAHLLEYEINGLGNIYYYGQPSVVRGKLNGQGKLIPMP